MAVDEPESGDEQLEEEEDEFDDEEYEDDEEEELQLDDHDNAHEYDDESSDFDDSDLLKRLDDKYGKLQQQQLNGNGEHDGEGIDPSWTSKAAPAKYNQLRISPKTRIIQQNLSFALCTLAF